MARSSPFAESDPEADAIRRVNVNALWLILQPLLLNAMGIPVLAYATRALGEVNYGRFVLGSSTALLVTGLCLLGTRAVAVRTMAARRADAARYAGELLAWRAVSGAVVMGLAAWLAASPSLGFSPPARRVFYAALAWQYLALLTGTLADYFHAHEKMALTARSQLAAGLVLNVATVFLLLLGSGLAGYCAAYVLGGAVGFGTALLGLRGLPTPHLRLRWGFVRELTTAAAPFMLLAVVGTVSSRLDVLIVTRFTGEAGAGLYGAAFGLIHRLIVVPDGIATSLYPALAAASAGQSAAGEGLLRRYLVWMGMVTLPIALAVWLLAPAIAAVLYGPRFAPAAPLLAMAIWLLPLAGVQMLAAALNAAHLQRITVRSSLLANGVVRAGLLLLTPRWGLIGAVAAVLLREAVGTAICGTAAVRRFPGCLDREALRTAAGIWTITATLAWLASMLPAGWQWAGIAVVMGGVYPTLLWRAGLLPSRRWRSPAT